MLRNKKECYYERSSGLHCVMLTEGKLNVT